MIMEALERAISFTHKKEIMIVGGVAANKRLSEMAQGVCGRHHSNFYVCPSAFAGDNGVQIAWTAILDYGSSKNRHINIEKSFLRQSWRLDSIDIIWRN
jgi:N6-L-threonylcarbamoyladenine synthase